MGSEATYPVGGGDPLSPLDIFYPQTPVDCTMEDLLRPDESAGHIPPDPQSPLDPAFCAALAEISDQLLLDESAGHIPPDPQSAGDDTSHAIAGPTGAEDQHEQNAHAGFDLRETGPGLIAQPATYSAGNPGPLTGTGTEEIPHSGSALLGFNMPEINGALTVLSAENNPPREPAPVPVVVNAMPGPDRDPYSTGDTSCPSNAADTGRSTLEQEVNAVPDRDPYSTGDILQASCKRKKLVCGSSSQRSTPPPEFNMVELLAGLFQSDPSSADIKPPTGSTDREIIDFLGREKISMPYGKKVNLSLGEQDRMAPEAVRSYVTTVQMMPDLKTHLGYWKEKEIKTVLDDKAGEIWTYYYYGLKKTFQFHSYDGTKTNWFMHEYIPTGYWGIDLFMEDLRFREVYKGAEVPGEPTSPQVKIKNKIGAAKKHRMRGPDDMVIKEKGESPVWQHFIKIYDRHPELEGSKVVYAVCCYCPGVLKAGAENGTNSLSTHCNRTCPCKHLQPSSS